MSFKGHRQFQSRPSQPPPPKQIGINYGHNGEEVLITFSERLRTLALTEEQAKALLEHVAMAQEKLKEHKAQQS